MGGREIERGVGRWPQVIIDVSVGKRGGRELLGRQRIESVFILCMI